jgi:5-methylcytosine-specific restriction endonuclease McrA
MTGQKHKPKAKSLPKEARGNAMDRGYDHKWHKFSAGFKRANPLCEYCLADGKIVASEVTDHDLPHQGDKELFWDNTFTALCAKCHNGAKQRSEMLYSGDDLLEWVRKRKTKRG